MRSLSHCQGPLVLGTENLRFRLGAVKNVFKMGLKLTGHAGANVCTCLCRRANDHGLKRECACVPSISCICAWGCMRVSGLGRHVIDPGGRGASG
jgi:hypothetical protein